MRDRRVERRCVCVSVFVSCVVVLMVGVLVEGMGSRVARGRVR